ncbi:MAG: 16S rRNA (cytidine(1402)-2'-O)-methyltransferase [Fusobacteria bacterium]|nr:16S rRNA (cytidine(1402)-2'-O)-methyltransferase [Fusobacteriota bacterium]
MFYIIATPIGNMEDITIRALNTLKEVDYIFAEDTRVTKKILNYYNIEKVVYQYHEHNKMHQSINIINLLKEGKKIGLTTDAGTPCISDPGYEVVKLAHDENIKVVAIPGASAMTAASSISGVNMRRIAFEGFLPKKKGRQTLFKKLQSEERTIVLFESPHRVIRTLNDIKTYLGERNIVIVREISKIYEEVIRGRVSELIEKIEEKGIKGEIVMIIDSESPYEIEEDDN